MNYRRSLQPTTDWTYVKQTGRLRSDEFLRRWLAPRDPTEGRGVGWCYRRRDLALHRRRAISAAAAPTTATRRRLLMRVDVL
jgi:hypothetical protein